MQGGSNFLSYVEVGLEHEDPSAWRGLVSGMAQRRFVHNEMGAGVCARPDSRATPIGQMPASEDLESSFSCGYGDGLPSGRWETASNA
jgi:hypothetical protein